VRGVVGFGWVVRANAGFERVIKVVVVGEGWCEMRAECESDVGEEAQGPWEGWSGMMSAAG
jgi:hypothetical protein